jgi:hypothetical protein
MGEAQRRRLTGATRRHFADWAPGSRMHAYLGTCIRCGSPDGDTVIYVRVGE